MQISQERLIYPFSEGRISKRSKGEAKVKLIFVLYMG